MTRLRETLLDGYQGCLLGLAVGDAIGTAGEFLSRDSFALFEMEGGGPFNLPPGYWTDDTAMALCLAESLLKTCGFDPHDQMQRYLRWWREGYMSSTGECFDIGNTVRESLIRYEQNGNPYAGSTSPFTAGNGSLMRLAPVILNFYPSIENVLHYCSLSSKTTHAAAEAVECCIVLGLAITKALTASSKTELIDLSILDLTQLKILSISTGKYLVKSRSEIVSSGYCVESLEAALWCFHQTEDFHSAILMAANLGDDADTVAAITGQIAGAYYGMKNIPRSWKEGLFAHENICYLASSLLIQATKK